MNSDVGFTCQQLEKDEVYRIDNSKSSCTLFIIEGDVIFDMGKYKWEQLGCKYELEGVRLATPEDVERAKEILNI